MYFAPKRYTEEKARERQIQRLCYEKSAARARRDWKTVREIELELRALEGRPCTNPAPIADDESLKVA